MISTIFLMPTCSRGSVIQFSIHVLNAHKFLHLIKDEPNLSHYFMMTGLKKLKLKKCFTLSYFRTILKLFKNNTNKTVG
jgi:hypothetical protein